jgi:hypothetical protein
MPSKGESVLKKLESVMRWMDVVMPIAWRERCCLSPRADFTACSNPSVLAILY